MTLPLWISATFVIAVAIMIVGPRRLNNVTSTFCRLHHAGRVSSSDRDLILHQARSILNQKLFIIDLIKPEDYSKKVEKVFNSSVGGHIRHSLDHFQAIVKAAESSTSFADYDTRARNTVIETDATAARVFVSDLMKAIDRIDLEKDIDISFIGETSTFRTFRIPSYIARELSFASHHGIHHLSMIKVLLNEMGYELPSEANIGMAPSTVKEEQRIAKEKLQ